MTEETAEKKVNLEPNEWGLNAPSIDYTIGGFKNSTSLMLSDGHRDYCLDRLFNDRIALDKDKKEFAKKQEEEKKKDKERSKRDTKANEKAKSLNEKAKSLNEREKSLDGREKSLNEREKSFDEEIAKKVSDAESKAKTIISDAESEVKTIISDAESEAKTIIFDAEKDLLKAKKVLADAEANKVANDKNLESINNKLKSFGENFGKLSNIQELLEDMALTLLQTPLDISELKELLKADTKKQNKKSDKASDSEPKTTDQTSFDFDSPYDKIVRKPYYIYMQCKGSSKCSKVGVLQNPKQIIRSLSNGNFPKLEALDEEGKIVFVDFEKLSEQNLKDFKKLLDNPSLT
tara:strand:+ start:5399 stop:6442 length:1044 start_codon:yes stop_codon:yes gene_type:complete